jgi:toxin YoeB
MRNITFTPKAFVQFNEWRDSDLELQDRLIRLIEETAKDPFRGLGKPEPLKHDLKGFWSRRITQEHRLVYEVRENLIVIISCKYHY